MSITRREATKLALLLTGSFAVGNPIRSVFAASQNETVSDLELGRDAEVAWHFFNSEVNGMAKGLVSAAVWPEGKDYGRYAILTMWDLGSLILAYISARSIGLMNGDDFDERISNVLAFLKKSRFRWRKLTLPNYRTSAAGSGSVENGYDSTDIGRLLVALYVLEKVTNGAYDIKKLLSEWDIGGTIKNGKLYDIKSSKLIASESYSYIYYVARAHKLWGYDVETGYDTKFDADNAAARKAFLLHVARNGDIASEPSANEAVEIGPSAQSRTLADFLYLAQLERFKETGKLTCVSEAPIDHEPWFTYQAFNPTGTGSWRWPVHSVTTSKRWETRAFAEKYRMVNSKAAFLWFALRGDAYAEKLRARISTKARTARHGFLPGVYENSGKSPIIMDVNTNAMVLQSVAYILAGRKPLAELKI